MNAYVCLLLCSTLTGNALVNDEFVFLRLYRTEARMYYMDGVINEIRQGYINRYGDFVTESVAINSSKNKEEERMHWRNVYNARWVDSELMYEYRDGMLVPGSLGGNKQFVPSRDPIVSMDEYLAFANKHSVDLQLLHEKPKSFPALLDEPRVVVVEKGKEHLPIIVRRIYNLPGVFVRKSNYDEVKKRLFKLPFVVENPGPEKKK